MGAGAIAQVPAANPAKDPQSLAELAPAAIPDEENAAAQIEQLDALINGWAHEQGVVFWNKPLADAFYAAVERGQRMRDEDAAALRKLLNDHAELDAGLQRAAACDKFASLGDFTQNGPQFLTELYVRVGRLRNIMRYYDVLIRMLTYEGQHEAAVRRGIEMLKLARLSEGEPTMDGYMVALGMQSVATKALHDALAAGRVSFDAHASLDVELVRIDTSGRFTRVLKSERAVNKTLEQPMPPGLANDTGMCDYLSRVIDASEQPWSEFYAQTRDDGKLLAPTGLGAVADKETQLVKAWATAHTRIVSELRALRVVNALRLFAKLHQREATGLAELELPAEATEDPITGAPLVLKLTDRGWAVYSVGDNGVDDGGQVWANGKEMMKDYGVGPRAIEN